MTDSIENRLTRGLQQYAASRTFALKPWSQLRVEQPLQRQRVSYPRLAWAAIIAVLVVAAGAAAFRSLDDGHGPEVQGRLRPAAATLSVQSAVPITGLGPATMAPEGTSVWVGGQAETNGSPQPILRFSPDGNITGTVTINDPVLALLVANGSLWAVTSRETGSAPYGALTRFDLESQQATGSIALESPGTGIASGFGSIWVSDPRLASIYRINATTLALEDTIRIDTLGYNSAGYLLATPEGIWVSDVRGSRVVRIDPNTRRPNMDVNLGSAPSQMAYASGKLWVMMQGTKSLAAIDVDAGNVTQTIEIQGRPLAMAANGGVLTIAVDTTNPEHRLVRVNATSGVLDPVLNDEIQPTQVIDTGGRVFVADTSGDLLIMR